MALDPEGPSSTELLTSYATQLGLTMPAPGAGTTGAGTDPNNPYIFFGIDRGNTNTYGRGKFSDIDPVLQDIERGDSDDLRTLFDSMQEFEEMDVAEQRNLARWLAIAGYTDGGTVDLENVDQWVEQASFFDVRSAYENLLMSAAGRFSVGQKITPNDLLKQAIAFRLGKDWNGDLGSLPGLGELGESLAKTWTTTSKSLDFMDPMDAKAMTRAMLQQELGRDPTQAEYEDFIAAVHAAEAANPAVTKTTYTTNADGQVVNQSSTTSGGITQAGVGQVMQDRAQSQPGWAEWQAMSQYAPALFAALGSTVPGT